MPNINSNGVRNTLVIQPQMLCRSSGFGHMIGFCNNFVEKKKIKQENQHDIFRISEYFNLYLILRLGEKCDPIFLAYRPKKKKSSGNSCGQVFE